MHTHRKNLILLLTALVCAILLFLLPENMKTKNDSGRNVIALVNGVEIYADDSRKTTNIVDVINSHQLNGEELNKAVKQYETTSFINGIRQTIIKHKIAELELSVSNTEVQSRLDDMFKTIDSNTANEIIKIGNATFGALREWQKDTSKSDIIYNDILVSLNVSKNNWELLKHVYDTPEALKKMQVPKTIEDMKTFSFESAKNDLLYQKLIDKVTKVTVTEDEVKEAYNLEYGNWNHDAPFGEVKDKIRELLMKEEQSFAFTVWLNEQYKKAKIEIKDKKYDDVLKILRTGNK
jgi:hypothetical protein